MGIFVPYGWRFRHYPRANRAWRAALAPRCIVPLKTWLPDWLHLHGDAAGNHVVRYGRAYYVAAHVGTACLTFSEQAGTDFPICTAPTPPVVAEPFGTGCSADVENAPRSPLLRRLHTRRQTRGIELTPSVRMDYASAARSVTAPQCVKAGARFPK